jgi:signal transduction histidine kinase
VRRLLRDPGWLLTMAVATTALVVSAAALAVRVARPAEGAVIRTESWAWTADGARVEPWSSRSAFEPGDLVVAMEGRPLVAWVESALVPTGGTPNPPLGDVIRFDVIRDGRAMQLDVARVPVTTERIDGAPIGVALLGVVILVLALALVRRRSRSTALRLLFVVAAAHVADITAWETGLQPTDFAEGRLFLVLFAAASVFNLVFWSAIVHLLAVYPVRSPLIARRPGLVPVVYLAPIVGFAALALVASLAGGTTLEWIDRLASCLAIVASVMVVVIIASVVAGYRRTAGQVRRSVRWVAAALVMAAVATLAFLTVPIVLTGTPLLPRNVVDLLVLPVPVALVAAVLRDRLFQVALLSRSREKIVAAREDERRKLRRDLHDGLAPTLAAVGLKLDVARQAVRGDPAEAEETIDDIRREIREVIADIRRMSRELRPPSLDALGLTGAVRQQADALQGPGGPRITVEADAGLPPLPAAVEVAAYRIAIEGMLNVVRHADASTCAVRMALVGNELEIDVEDDGRGVDAGGGGVGMRSMRERAAEIGGDVTIGPGPERGTILSARLPVDLSLLARAPA